ncbi:NTP transferase domain-containing protein [Smaragdicoccus niigatensis]|uniref:NTP transferase domain-containing protein n=1 Tax=Smaragdicoccus niigatensis TaxID=359359 RepID=UPI0003705080|nr:NTP transferase domain-containing protein [Smaragdicoccus niigatensis]
MTPPLRRADAIILAGGRATRMGGVDKPGLIVGGRSMLATAIDVVSECATVVVVGPQRDLPAGIVQVQESPAGSGPVSGIAAGLAALPAGSEFVVVLAADLPFISRTSVQELVDACQNADAAFASDPDGNPQYLAAAWRTAALREQLHRIGSLENQPMKRLVPAHLTTVPLADVNDCDTPADVTAARRASTRSLSIEEARETIETALRPLTPRQVPAHQALGSTLAEPLVAASPLPRFDLSAMDGYAVSGDGPWRLRSDVGYAGGVRPDRLDDGEAVRIATGAHLPPGATSVLRDEFATVRDDVVTRTEGTPVRDDRRQAGESWQPGDVLVPAGTVVSPAVISVAASAEVAELVVRGPVRAHVVVTGDEIRREGPLREGQTRDSIGPILPNFLRWFGVQTKSEAHLRDTASGFDAVLAETDAELIVVIGATGHGAADQLRTALERAGADLLVQRVQTRPGGSQIVACLRDGRVVVGLPGNPFAAIATAGMQIPGIAAALTALTTTPREYVRLANAEEVAADSTRVIPGNPDGSGRWLAHHPRFQTAHLAALTGQSGLLVIPPGTSADDLVEVVRIPSGEM